MSRFYLSICIPTYNRVSHVKKMVYDLLAAEEVDFNIVVQDNYSTDGTETFFANLNDNRVVYRRNDSNLGAAHNYLASLMDNDSEYSLLVIDKDHINVSFIKQFLSILRKEGPDYGYLSLNTQQSEPVSFRRYEKGIAAIRETAYLSKHPTGFFYRSRLINKEIFDDYFSCFDKSFPFPFEIINAHLGVNYMAMVLTIPLLHQESREEAAVAKSYSFNEKNLFFSPEKRLDAFEKYYLDLFGLEIGEEEKIGIFKDLYNRVLQQVSVDYKRIMNDDVITAHYGIMKRKVSLSEMIINMRLTRYLITHDKRIRISYPQTLWLFYLSLARIGYNALFN